MTIVAQLTRNCTRISHRTSNTSGSIFSVDSQIIRNGLAFSSLKPQACLQQYPAIPTDLPTELLPQPAVLDGLTSVSAHTAAVHTPQGLDLVQQLRERNAQVISQLLGHDLIPKSDPRCWGQPDGICPFGFVDLQGEIPLFMDLHTGSAELSRPLEGSCCSPTVVAAERSFPQGHFTVFLRADPVGQGHWVDW